METATIGYLDETLVTIGVLTIFELNDMLKSEHKKKMPSENWEDCYALEDKYIIAISDAGFIVDGKESFNKFLTRTAFVKDVLNNRFLFFELVEKEVLNRLCNNTSSPVKLLQHMDEVDLYELTDRKVLVADKYLRGGEIFMSYDDYLLYQRLMP